MTETKNPIILENGSHTCKAGFGGNWGPHVVFPSVIASSSIMGESAMNAPLNCATYTSLNTVGDYEHFTEYSFRKLQVDPTEHSVLINCPKHLQEQFTEIMFEKFQVAGLCYANQAPLAAYSVQKTSGIVVDCGHLFTRISPVCNLNSVQEASITLECAGDAVSKKLKQLLIQKAAMNLEYFRQIDLIDRIKAEIAYVSMNPKKENFNACTLFRLPDGRNVDIRNERFLCSEVLFEDACIQDSIFESISKLTNNVPAKSNVDTSTIIVTGGSSRLNGFSERLALELSKKMDTRNMKIIEKNDIESAAWLGGSLLTCCSAFKDMCTTLEKYQELGRNVLCESFQ